MFKVLVIVFLLGLTQAEKSSSGSCPKDVAVVQDFDLQQYAGRWYEHARYPSMFEKEVRCVYEDYQLQLIDEVSIRSSNINEKNEHQVVVFNGKVTSPGKLAIHYNLSGVSGDVNYWILGTDYKSYSVVYSCYQFSESYTQLIWILSRQQKMSSAALHAAFDVMTQHGLPLQPLVERNQSNCYN